MEETTRTEIKNKLAAIFEELATPRDGLECRVHIDEGETYTVCYSPTDEKVEVGYRNADFSVTVAADPSSVGTTIAAFSTLHTALTDLLKRRVKLGVGADFCADQKKTPPRKNTTRGQK